MGLRESDRSTKARYDFASARSALSVAMVMRLKEAYTIVAPSAPRPSRSPPCGTQRVAESLRLDVSGVESPIRGITSVDNVAILNIEGTGTSAVPDLTSRLFGTLARADEVQAAYLELNARYEALAAGGAFDPSRWASRMLG